MSSPSPADPPAAWEHGLSSFVIERLRLLIPSLEGRYDRLDKLPPGSWGYALAHYALFQRLRRREGETKADHRIRQARWLRERRAWEQENREPRTLRKNSSTLAHDIRAAWPDLSGGAEIALGPWAALGPLIVSPEEIAGSELEDIVALSPTGTGRVLVFDIAADKDLLMERISRLIDHEREAAGIAQITRRGRKSRTDGKPELAEFLRSIREHRIVQLWDLQLVGQAASKLATSRVLYPEKADPTRGVSSRSIPRGLLETLAQARKLQDQVEDWLPRLLATV